MDDLIRRQGAVSRFSDLLMVELEGKRLPTWEEVYNAMQGLPSAQPEIVRCKDCKFWREHKYAKYAKGTKRYIPFCGLNAIYTKSDDFCSKGERRTDEIN